MVLPDQCLECGETIYLVNGIYCEDEDGDVEHECEEEYDEDEDEDDGS